VPLAQSALAISPPHSCLGGGKQQIALYTTTKTKSGIHRESKSTGNRMKTTLKYLAVVGVSIVTVTWPSPKLNATEKEDLGAREAVRRMELQDENGQIPPNALSDAYAEKDAMPFLPEAWSEFVSPAQAQTGVKGGSWVSIGPGNVGGRIRSIIIRPADPIHPEADRTMWAGGVAGGVWKSTNSGGLWSTNTDRLANLAVNCMALEPGYHGPDHDVLYAGTGEGFNNGDAVQGNGIYKTTDGGASWNVLPFTYNNPDFIWVNRLAISPTNSQLLLAAVKINALPGDPCPGCPRGKILRSTNGGTTWTTTGPAPFPAPMTDVRFKPSGTEAPIPDVPLINCIASVYTGLVYFSTDDGAT
jgi:hypothetical protein